MLYFLSISSGLEVTIVALGHHKRSLWEERRIAERNNIGKMHVFLKERSSLYSLSANSLSG